MTVISRSRISRSTSEGRDRDFPHLIGLADVAERQDGCRGGGQGVRGGGLGNSAGLVCRGKRKSQDRGFGFREEPASR